MSQWLTSVVAKIKKLGQGQSAPRPRRTARPGVEALEGRLVMSGITGGWWSGTDPTPPSNPWSYTLPSGHGSDTIRVSVSGGQLQVLDNNAPVPGTPLSLAGITSVSLKGGTNTTNTFLIQGTPVGIPVGITFATGSDSAVVGSAGSVQGIQSALTIQGDYGSSKVTVDDSADTGTRTATMSGGALSGLAPGLIQYGAMASVIAKGGSSAGNFIKMYNPQSAGNSFTGRPTYSTFTGSGYSLEADNFAQVDAVSLASGDTAVLWGGAGGANTFAANRPTSTLSWSGHSLQVDYFRNVTALSGASGSAATLYGLAGGTNTFTGRPTYSYLSGSAYYDEADGFAGVTAISNSAADVAYLYGAASGHNSLWSSPTNSTLSGGSYAVEADYFPQVKAYSNVAGDEAHLRGASSGTNTFTGRPASLAGSPAYASLTGGGYSIEANGFGSVTANSHSAYDVANLSCADRNSELLGLSTSAFLGGFGWGIQVNNFYGVNVSGNAISGADLVSVGSAPSYVSGTPTGANFYGSGWYIQVSGFGGVGHDSYPDAYSASKALNLYFYWFQTEYGYVGNYQLVLSDPYGWNQTVSW